MVNGHVDAEPIAAGKARSQTEILANTCTHLEKIIKKQLLKSNGTYSATFTVVILHRAGNIHYHCFSWNSQLMFIRHWDQSGCNSQSKRRREACVGEASQSTVLCWEAETIYQVRWHRQSRDWLIHNYYCYYLCACKNCGRGAKIYRIAQNFRGSKFSRTTKFSKIIIRENFIEITLRIHCTCTRHAVCQIFLEVFSFWKLKTRKNLALYGIPGTAHSQR